MPQGTRLSCRSSDAASNHGGASETETLTDLRFKLDGGSAMLDGPPCALRRLARLLRDAQASDVEVMPGEETAIMRQMPTEGP